MLRVLAHGLAGRLQVYVMDARPDQVGKRCEERFALPQPLEFRLPGLHLILHWECLSRIDREVLDPTTQHALSNIQIARLLAPATPRSVRQLHCDIFAISHLIRCAEAWSIISYLLGALRQ